MKIAVDKNSVKAIKKDGNEYIYLFDNEPLNYLIDLKIHCVHYSKCDFCEINLTDYNIDCIKKSKITENDYDKLPELVNYKIGIIIPNYNYEHTIEKCLNSIFSQSYKNVEIIFIDDMSTDDSVLIARKTYEKYLFNHNDIKMKIVRLKQKRLNGGARNEGYLHLSDDVDYIYYIDSDDWINEGALRDINLKLQKKPDVLFVGMDSYKNEKQRECYIPQYKDKYEAMQGWSGSCGKVIKKSLATRQECLYNEGTLKEDRNQHRRICFYMKGFELLKKPIYVWNQSNMKSVTTVRDEVMWGTSTIRHYADTKQFYLSVKGKDKKVDRILKQSLKQCKDEILNGGDRQW